MQTEGGEKKLCGSSLKVIKQDCMLGTTRYQLIQVKVTQQVDKHYMFNPFFREFKISAKK